MKTKNIHSTFMYKKKVKGRLNRRFEVLPKFSDYAKGRLIQLPSKVFYQ